MISPATKTIESAMAASTGGPGDVHPSERRGDQCQAVRDRERGHRCDQTPHAIHKNHQRQHEQQVVEPGEDVLDAECGVGPHDLECSRGWP